jgi:rhamnosyltransferase
VSQEDRLEWGSDMSHSPLVTIVMSTYNGERFVRQQLDSLIEQKYANWCLLIRDDGSSDSTVNIIDEYQSRDARIRMVRDTHGNLGPAKSFICLLQQVTSPIFMCCDQDDIWLPHKVHQAVDRLEGSGDIPKLFFTDLVVVDDALNVIAESFMTFQKFNPHRASSIKGLLMQNVVVGCTMAGNHALLKLIQPAALKDCGQMLMHDWWLALLASAFGTIEYSPVALILYRQHGGNSLGAPGSNFARYIAMLRNTKPWERASLYICKVALQCSAFGRTYGYLLNCADVDAIEKVAALASSRSCVPLARALIAGLTMNGWLRNAALFFSVVVHPTSRNVSFHLRVVAVKEEV